jgi:RNA polymerase sigma-70 factor (ECF subfamily)
MTEQEEDRLVARAQQGDHTAFDVIVAQYADQVYRLALRMLNDEDDARDAQQESFIRIVKQIGRFRGDAALATWIYAITANVCLSWRRRRQRRPTEAIADVDGHLQSEQEPLNGVLAFVERAKIERVLQRLAPADRLILLLRFVEGLDHRSIAHILHCSEESSRTRLSLARKQFRRWFGEE